MNLIESHSSNHKLHRPILDNTDNLLSATQNIQRDRLHHVFSRRAEALASRCRSHAKETRKIPILVFEIGSETYGIKLNELSQITPMHKCTLVPNSAAYVVGIVNLYGNVCCIVDLAYLLGHKNNHTEPTGYLLYLRSYNYTIGFRIDRVNQVDYTTENELDASGHKSEHTHGVTKDGVCLLNIQHLIKTKLNTAQQGNL